MSDPLKNSNRLLLAFVFLIAGLILVWKNSWGHYFDPWVKGMFKGRMSYWFIVAGIALLLAALILFIPLRNKQKARL